MNLIDTYRNAPATDQARLLMLVMDEHAWGNPPVLSKPGTAVDPNDPRCPQCGNPIAEVNAVNFSTHLTEAVIDAANITDQCAKRSDFHVTHYLTRCCQAAVSFDDRFTIDYL